MHSLDPCDTQREQGDSRAKYRKPLVSSWEGAFPCSDDTGSKKRGQQAIDPSRAREIQTALIREHYLQGQPSGTWDSVSQAAMQKYQADHGWQSKTTPDARALIKLGLGPSQEHLLNPERAMTAASASADAHPTSAQAAAADPKTPAKSTPADTAIPKQ